MDKLSILIINHETPEGTSKLIKHIRKYFNPQNYDLTVVDNSTWFPLEESDIQNTYNKGFDQVVIDWLKNKRKEKYIGYWTLNSDCLLKPIDYTSELLKYLKEDHNIGLLSTLVNETKGWGNTEPLAHPQNIRTNTPAQIGYIDFQSAIISHNLLNKFLFNNDLVYYLGGLDMDFNLCCEKWGYLKVLLPHLEITHLGAQSYREKNGDLIYERIDATVDKEQEEHISKLHLEDTIKSGNGLMEYGIQKRYGVDIFVERSRMVLTPSISYKIKGE
jgi:GT2 family glycosyltransferase